MKLIEYEDKNVHPIDKSRIYISGFSMGSMFTNALAAAWPDVFAGAVAINGPHIGYLQTFDEALPGIVRFRPDSRVKGMAPNGEKESPVHVLSDEKGDELYHFVTVRRMPHAVDTREPEIGWNIIKHYRRNKDGSLEYKA